MEAFELKKGFYFTGAIDHNLRVFDIIMYTEFGTTYNSYVLKTGKHTVAEEGGGDHPHRRGGLPGGQPHRARPLWQH